MSHKLVSLYIGDGEYYTRIDADTVITELKARIAQLEDDNALLRKNNAELREATRWRKFPDEKPDVKPGEGTDVLVVVDYYNTYDTKCTRGRYVTEAEYYVDEEGCFYRAYSDQEIDETFHGENGEECYEKVIMWRPLPKAPEVK